jgi:hypothetical protein
MGVTMEYDIDSPEYQEKFWAWCIDNGYHNEDYILDHLEVFEEMFEETLE